MVENITLLTNAPEHDFVGVNMYVDDAGASKALQLNARASDIGTTCGKPIEVPPQPFCNMAGLPGVRDTSKNPTLKFSNCDTRPATSQNQPHLKA